MLVSNIKYPMLKRYLVFIQMMLFFVSPLMAQKNKPNDPDVYLRNGKKYPEVLLVGTWHFNYPGLDAHQPAEDKRINIYSDRRQKELQELINYIALFKPTKIILESGPITGYLEYNYKEWKAGREELMANERSQLGMRLMELCKLDTVYGADDWPLMMQLAYDSSLKNIPYLNNIYERHYFGGDDDMQKKYTEFYNYENDYFLNHTLLEGFTYLNSDKVMKRYFGAYIAGGQFASEEKEGPDALSMFWFNRNLRIFRNIQKIESNADDRILVLFGAGHAAILQWFFECSPEYNLVKFEDLEKWSKSKNK